MVKVKAKKASFQAKSGRKFTVRFYLEPTNSLSQRATVSVLLQFPEGFSVNKAVVTKRFDGSTSPEKGSGWAYWDEVGRRAREG